MAWSIRYLVCIRVAAVSSRIALPTPDTSNSRGGESVMKGKTYLSTVQVGSVGSNVCRCAEMIISR